MGTVVLHGTVESGVGEGATFTQLDWVKARFRALLGFEPFPGTLNVRLVPQAASTWTTYRQLNGLTVEPATPDFCEARLFPALLKAEKNEHTFDQVAIVWPLVPGYPDDVVELVAPVKLREYLQLRDGDHVVIMLRQAK